jgi:DNA (cytosine-5)-methyltransferase 1
VLDLFSGIGGFSLGLERAGMRTVQFVELDPFCRAVLAQHWPDVPCHDDIRTFHPPVGFADVICGGFPCQDISIAGFGAGLAGERSGLWTEFARIIGAVRPRFAVVENVSALLHRGLGEVLGDLAEIGYDAEWHCIPAAAVGAPHRRDRIWIVAYPARDVRPEQVSSGSERERVGESGAQEPVAYTMRGGREGPSERGSVREGEQRRPTAAMADSDREGQLQPRGPLIEIWRWLGDGGEALANTEGSGCHQRTEDAGRRSPRAGENEWTGLTGSGWWELEPDVGRVAHGVPARVDRLRSLGNAVVPQIPEIIGRAIMRAST